MGKRTVFIVAGMLAGIAASNLYDLLDMLGISRSTIVITSMAAAGVLLIMLSFNSMRERFRK
jgi:hypothetical protein